MTTTISSDATPVPSTTRAAPVPPVAVLDLPHVDGSTTASPAVTGSPGFRDLRTDHTGSSSFSFMQTPSALEQERIQTHIENLLLSNIASANQQKEAERLAKSEEEVRSGGESSVQPSAFELNDLVGFFRGGMDVIVQDGFSRCFERSRSQPWNWNLYLWPLWVTGVIVRYGILFPLRLTSLLLGLVVVLLCLTVLSFLPLPSHTRSSAQRKLIRFLCGVFVFSWTGVIKYHGTLPKKKPGQIYVSNHTSMIDVIILSQMNTFSMVGQKHTGWVGFLQTHVLGIIGTVWFQRGEASDRIKSAQKMRDHIHNPNSNRLLVFPEGTCVNNEYCVQFKQGVFDMDAEVCPIAMKYNKIFVDGFWDSKAQSFQGHLMTLMCSWAVVCDVYYLEPQRIAPGETAIDFSNRVKKVIADRAGLKNVSYDGYLKHFEVKQSLIEKQQKMYADVILNRLTDEEQQEIAAAEAEEAASKAKATAAAIMQAARGTTDTVDSPTAAAAAASSAAATAAPISPSSAASLHLANDSSANLIALLNQVEAEERRALTQEATITKRK